MSKGIGAYANLVVQDRIKTLFIRAYNEQVFEKKEIIANIELIKKTLFDLYSGATVRCYGYII